MYLLHGGRNDFEVGWDVTPEDASFQRLHVPADVRLRRKEMAFEHVPVGFFVSVRHYHLAPIRLNLKERFPSGAVTLDRKPYSP